MYTFVHETESQKAFSGSLQLAVTKERDEIATARARQSARSNQGVETECHRQQVPKSTSSATPKYRQVYEDLLSAIKSGSFQPGDRLPSEAELGKHYDTSRITVAKAVKELQILGLVSRRAGSGTHVLAPATSTGHVFGLLIPDLGRTEIFEPICHGMMQSPLSKPHSLLWGHSMGEAAQQEKEAEHLCHQYVRPKSLGRLFCPAWSSRRQKDAVNKRIVAALDHAGIQIVLLDRCYAPYFLRSKYDLVGIDNRRAGFLITHHLLLHGVKRIAFIAKPLSASTVVSRIAGYREALFATEVHLDRILFAEATLTILISFAGC